MMDEADYPVRLEGYKETEQLIAERADKAMLLLLVHNCCFFITNVCIAFYRIPWIFYIIMKSSLAFQNLALLYRVPMGP